MDSNKVLVEVESDDGGGEGYLSLPLPDSTVSELVEALVAGRVVELGGFGRVWVRMHKGHPSNYTKDGRVLKDYPVVRLRVSGEVLSTIRERLVGNPSIGFEGEGAQS